MCLCVLYTYQLSSMNSGLGHSRNAANCAGHSSLRPYLRVRGRKGQQRDPAKDDAWDVRPKALAKSQGLSSVCEAPKITSTSTPREIFIIHSCCLLVIATIITVLHL